MWTFNDIFKQTIWGGNRIPQFKGVKTDLTGIGESWEISGVKGSESVVANGPDAGLTLSELIAKYGEDLMGKKNMTRFGDNFPLLIKLIDAEADLSVQVHPDDELARKRGSEFGKTEMWYVVGASKGAKLANGFNTPVDPADYQRLVSTGEIENVLRFCPIAPGDVYFIPAGRVHAIGKGSFVAEILETSDITYRLYDYRRKDAQGHERQLHTEEAFEAVDFNDTKGEKVDYIAKENIPVNVVTSPFFTTNVLTLDTELMRDYSEWDTFVILIATEGEALVKCGDEEITLKAGHSVLIPASAKNVSIIPHKNFTALETYVK